MKHGVQCRSCVIFRVSEMSFVTEYQIFRVFYYMMQRSHYLLLLNVCYLLAGLIISVSCCLAVHWNVI